jgi:hypothetical protein
MPFDAQGIFTLDPTNPVTSGTVIQPSWANPTLADIAQGLTETLVRDGRAPMTGPLVLSGDAAAPLVATPLQQVNSLIAAAAPGTATPTSAGIVRLATSSEANAGTDVFHAMTPSTTRQAQGTYKGSSLITATYNLAAADIGKLLLLNNATSQQIVTEGSGSTNFTALSTVTIMVANGTVTITPGAGSVLLGSTLVGTSGSTFTLTRLDNIYWMVSYQGQVASPPNATETVSGIIELATTAEASTGTDTTRAITAAGLTASELGRGQTWQAVTRPSGTLQTNNTGRPIILNIAIDSTPGAVGGATIVIGASPSFRVCATGPTVTGIPGYAAGSVVIPNGATYTPTYTSVALVNCHELR